MTENHTFGDSGGPRDEPLADAWSTQIEQLQDLQRVRGIEVLRGFPAALELRYQADRAGFVQFLLRISMAFALLSYPLYLEFDRFTVRELCHDWVYVLAYGVATPMHALILGLTFLPTKSAFFYRLAGMGVLVANAATMILATAIGVRLDVPVPFEMLMLMLLYVFFLVGFPFRIAASSAAGVIFLYALGNALAGIEAHRLIQNIYFLASLASMCAVGCGLAEIADRRGWLSTQMLKGFSERDGLTGLYHRGAFETRATMALRIAHRDRMTVSLAVFDLDHFKLLNDRLGHLEGDRCLRRVASLLATEPPLRRPLDFPARLGGEEFGIIWFGADAAWVSKTLQTLSARLKALGIKNPGAPGGVLTTSVGVAHYGGEQEMSVDSLLQQADIALYEAKRSGRNQIHVFDPAARSAA